MCAVNAFKTCIDIIPLSTPTAYTVTYIPWSGTPSFSFVEGVDNGMISMRVLNALTAHIATSSI